MDELPPQYITAKQLAQRWAISLSAVYNCKAGTHALTRIRFSGTVRFLLSEVESIERESLTRSRRKVV